GGDHGIHARRGAAVVAAGFERDVEGTAGYVHALGGRITQCTDFGMGAASLLGGALAEHLTLTHDDATHAWVGSGDVHDASCKRHSLMDSCHHLVGKMGSTRVNCRISRGNEVV